MRASRRFARYQPGSVLLVALGLWFMVATVMSALAQGPAPRADDGRTLFDESPATITMFTAVWGQDAAERWVVEHNAELAARAPATPTLPTVLPTAGPTSTVAPTVSPGASMSLVNSEWRLVSFGAAGTEDPALPQATVTLQFGADGRLGGFGGCNSYGGRYEVRGASLTVSEVVSTLRACLDDAVTQQEGRYLGALDAAEQYVLTGDRLTLSSMDGTRVLNLVRR